MNGEKLMNFALSVGEVMLSSGAETYRVEDTINRILAVSKNSDIESFVTPTGIFVTMSDIDNRSITVIRRVKNRQIHLYKIEMANKLSRDFCSGQLTLNEAIKSIKTISKNMPYKPLIMIPSVAFSAALFTIVLGGNLIEGGITLIAGIFLSIICYLLDQYKIPRFFTDLIGSFVATCVIIITLNIVGYDNNMDLIIIGGLMPLVPGVAITNAVRDTLHGDLVSGSARILDAFIIAASIATGVGLGLSMMSYYVGGVL